MGKKKKELAGYYSRMPITTIAEMERLLIIRALESVNNCRKEAAKVLGISKRSLYYKLKKYCIKMNPK